jgi:comEA protein
MNLTSSQKKAILFIIVFFFLAVAYHWIERVLHPVEPYDFSQFEEKFYARYDSIQEVLAENSSNSRPVASNDNDMRRNLSGSKHSDKPDVKRTAEEVNESPQLNANQPLKLININTATVEELITLPRIGPKIAARIVDYRKQHGNFTVKKDLTKVKGIGPKTFEKLRHLITVE